MIDALRQRTHIMRRSSLTTLSPSPIEIVDILDQLESSKLLVNKFYSFGITN